MKIPLQALGKAAGGTEHAVSGGLSIRSRPRHDPEALWAGRPLRIEKELRDPAPLARGHEPFLKKADPIIEDL